MSKTLEELEQLAHDYFASSVESMVYAKCLGAELKRFAEAWKAEVGQLLANQIMQEMVQGGDVRYLGILLRKAIVGEDDGACVWPCPELEDVRRWILAHNGKTTCICGKQPGECKKGGVE